jgi:release factor glutamine methyltransferase
MSLIYEPAEDSYLLLEVLEKEIPLLLEDNTELKVLEIGSGSGIQLKTLLHLGVKKENIFGCDINPDAILHCQNLGFNVINSDLFSDVSGKFDLIIFNPPYLPIEEGEDKDSQLATTSGIKGSKLINRFLKKADSFLTSNGEIFLLISSLTKGVRWRNYQKELLTSKKLFFEGLEVWKIKP